MTNYIYLILLNISFSMWVTFILIMWFDGDITNLFSRTKFLEKILLRKEYQEYKTEEDIMATYPDFLYARYDNFITKLISCVICLPAWLTLSATILQLIIFNVGIIWSLIFLPINYIMTLIVYLLIRKLL